MSLMHPKHIKHVNGSGVRGSRRLPGLGVPDAEEASASRHWFERAQKVLAGGISSSARSTTSGSRAYPLYIARGQGSRVWDADGNEFIDHLLGYGSSILGHADAEWVAAVNAQLAHGTMFGTCNTIEVELAEEICAMVPCAELVRFANSGSEAIQGAVRAARGFTGRTKILKFEGHYHGWVDVLAVSNRPSEAEYGDIDAPVSRAHSLGMPGSVVDDIVICPWNDAARLDQILDRYAGQFAAVIAEPIVANNACIMPRDGYLEHLREACTKRGVVLIYDEIVTGFRIAPGGAQEWFGVHPDIAVYSKAIGGGFPLSAFAGRHDIMEPIGRNTVKHGGTYNGNPACATSALHTLRRMSDGAGQAKMNEMGGTLMEAIKKSAADANISCVVQGIGSMFQVIFGQAFSGGKQPAHYRDLLHADTKRYAAFHSQLLSRGIHANSSGLACWFISTSHTENDIAIAVKAIEASMQAIA